MFKVSSTFIEALRENRFSNKDKALEWLAEKTPELGTDEMATLFVSGAYLAEALNFLGDQFWLLANDKLESHHIDYPSLLTEHFDKILSPLSKVKPFLEGVEPRTYKGLKRTFDAVNYSLVESARALEKKDKRDFARNCFVQMQSVYLSEEKSQSMATVGGGHIGPQLYKSFDLIDVLFDLDYQQDFDMTVDHKQKERLYQGSGAGVQSGYSTILLALHFLDLPDNATVLDLGSGYGRVGLALSLMRDDVCFTGYEYVEHRVDNSNETAKGLLLDEKLKFVAQDLSDPDFILPVADVYYLYDPFTEETYRFILNQIAQIGRERKISVVIKGNAKKWLDDLSVLEKWETPQVYDEGNLCIYRSFS